MANDSVLARPTSLKGREETCLSHSSYNILTTKNKMMKIFFNFTPLRSCVDQRPNLLVRWVNTTIKQRRRDLDVDLWRQRPFVIVDPSDPEEILYLRESEFHQYQRVSLSNGINLTIIARDTTPQAEIGRIPSNDNNSNKEEISSNQSSSSHLKKSPPLLGLIGTFFESGKDSLVDLTHENAHRLCFKYIVKLYYWSLGTKSPSRHRMALEFAKSLVRILDHKVQWGSFYD